MYAGLLVCILAKHLSTQIKFEYLLNMNNKTFLFLVNIKYHNRLSMDSIILGRSKNIFGWLVVQGLTTL